MKAFNENKQHFTKDGTPVLSLAEIQSNEQTQIVIDHLLARASTKWTIDQSNIFFCALTKIDNMNDEGEIKISKRELYKRLSMDQRNSNKLKKNAIALMETSKVEFNPVIGKDGKDRSQEWEAGMLVTYVTSDRYNIYITFNKRMIPLLKNLKMYFTKIDLDSLLSLKKIGAQKLYIYLSSWFNDSYPVQVRTIYKKDLPIVFGLSKNQYTRNRDKPNERFDFYMFERKVLIPACEEITKACQAGKCDLDLYEEPNGTELIDPDGTPIYEATEPIEPRYYEKLIDDPFVTGYRFHYRFLDKDGNHAWINAKRT